MEYRSILVVPVAVALLVSGCNSDAKTTAASTSKAASSSSAASSPASESTSSPASDEASAPLDGEACVEVTGASLDLSTATNNEEARTAADTLEKYNPPAAAKTAIEHFVTTGGAQFDDPDYSKSNKDLDGWVHEVCPT